MNVSKILAWVFGFLLVAAVIFIVVKMIKDKKKAAASVVPTPVRATTPPTVTGGVINAGTVLADAEVARKSLASYAN